jgi:hypothetical protein
MLLLALLLAIDAGSLVVLLTTSTWHSVILLTHSNISHKKLYAGVALNSYTVSYYLQ